MIGTECINCGACAYECPVRAIGPGPSQFEIDPAVCVECDGYFPVQRCKAACPVGACQPEREVLLAKARSLAARGAPPVRVRRAA
jgi:ferredoxin